MFVGAGISRNSGVPVVWDIIEEVLKTLRVEDADRTKIHETKIPFEGFMQVLIEASGVIESLLDIFEADDSPNANHRLIAKLVKAGKLKTIVTTNFDMLIERALENELLVRGENFEVLYREEDFQVDAGVGDKVVVIKIHGSMEDKNNLAVTLNRVATQLYSQTSMDVIRHVFSGEPKKNVLVMGYSFSDMYDILPQIEAVPRRHRNYITCIEHDEDDALEIEDVALQTENNPLRKDWSQGIFGYKGRRVPVHTDRFVEVLWKALQDEEVIEGNLDEETDEAMGKSKKHGDWTRHLIAWRKNVEAKYTEAAAQICPLIAGALFNWVRDHETAQGYFRKSLGGQRRLSDPERNIEPRPQGPEDTERQIRGIRNSFDKNKTAVFVGSGLSIVSGVPTPHSIQRYLLEGLGVAAKDISVFDDANLPLETFVQIVIDECGVNQELTEMFQSNRPNYYHWFLTQLMIEGRLKTIVTTNPDTLIEQALEIVGVDHELISIEAGLPPIDWSDNTKRRVIKLRGTHSAPRFTDFMHQLLLPESREAIRYVFSDWPHDNVLCLGWSAIDFVDVSPQIETIPEDSPRKNIFQLCHTMGSLMSEDIAFQNYVYSPNPFRLFQGRRIFDDTMRFVDQFGDPPAFSSDQPSFPFVWKNSVDAWLRAIEIEGGVKIKTFLATVLFSWIGESELAQKYIRKGIKQKDRTPEQVNPGLAKIID